MLTRTSGFLLLFSLAALPLAAQKAPPRLRRVAEARENAFTIPIAAGAEMHWLPSVRRADHKPSQPRSRR
jgi:hypothetical protein